MFGDVAHHVWRHGLTASHHLWFPGYVSDTVAERIRSRLQVRNDLPPPSERRALRQAAGLSQKEMADAIGVTRAAVSHWESGARTPRGKFLDRYAEAVRVLRSAA